MTTNEGKSISNEDPKINDYLFTIRMLSAGDGGGYLIEYPDLPGCLSDGETPAEAIQNGRDALRSVILTRMAFEDPIPEPGSSSLVTLPPDLTSRLNDRAQRQGVKPESLAAEILLHGLEEPAV